ncbi:MAG: DNA mismatch repair protein MutS [Ruminococcaceae bacterium]|nr:DNA mismatch repair protein MutS [Oscillospiraceae bacterium]
MALTPMMQQYFQIKDQYRDHILFYRLGDFYEMFFEDAQIASKELELTLTGRDCGEEQRAPMCGVPFHSSEGYIGRLIAKGYKVAICEQTEDPALAKGLVKREVIRVITPGTVIEADLLTEQKNNYLASLFVTDGAIGVCFADVSTAEMRATSFEGDSAEADLLTELSTYGPREVIVNTDLDSLPRIAGFFKDRSILVTPCLAGYYGECAEIRYRRQFGAFEGSERYSTAVVAAGAALGYISDTQKSDISYITKIDIYENSQFLEMDMSTRRNLELCETMLTKDKKGSLLWVLDKTSTAMGARLLRSLIEHPLTNVKDIVSRQRSVGELYDNFMLREEIRDTLSSVLDLERLMTKITYGTASARELRAVCQTVKVLPHVKSMLESAQSAELSTIWKNIDELSDIYELIEASIVDSPPFQVREGGMIRDGYNATVDELRSIMNNAEDYIKGIEEREKEATGIKTLKIKNNKVFGYYIEVSKSFMDQVPSHYIRKQTLANGERYITEELKELEGTIFGASDKVKNLEYELFSEIRNHVADNSQRIRQSAQALAELDVFVSLAEVAAKGGYVCPEVDNSDVIVIKDGRHPVVEKFVKDAYFVPNDTDLDTRNNRMMLITGPNMAGKSTYMRQTALIVLMAQIGSFVPASDARIGVVDKLFTRVGASDDLASGQSTFMLEMQEVAYILKNATNRSFIIYDEIGRGTSTFDGMSIARAVLEYTAGKKLGTKTMFATHYHELTDLEGEIDGVVNYNVAVKKRGDDLTFLRKIVRGPVDESYGIEVAKLAGIPKDIVKRAKEILRGLEDSGETVRKQPRKDEPEELDLLGGMSLSLADMARDSVCDEIRKTDINTLTPIEAMNLIFRWKKDLE